MTVSSTVSSVRYAFTGAADYTFNFLIFEESDIHCYHTNATTGVVTKLTRIDDYTVSFTPGISGGTVTITWNTVTSGTLEIRRKLPFTQETDWVNNDAFSMELLETAFDRAVMLLQQMQTSLDEGSAETIWKGNWATDTNYIVRDVIITPDDDLYVCAVAHTSGTLANDIAAGYWKLILASQELMAYKWANEAEDTVVEDGEYSAYHHKVKALAAQTAAELAETNALASENAAATSETNAATSETNAATSETNAATSESNAAASESAAATSESNAAISESNAADSASAAAISETNAAASESAAAISESNAAASESAAATSESNAAISESNAADSASDVASAKTVVLAAKSEALAAADATVYSPTTTYNYPDTVIGSDGFTYRCLGTGVSGDNPVTSTSGNWLALLSSGPPVGTIVPYLPGYFTDASNGGFTTGLSANTIAAANAEINPVWYVCDGSALDDSSTTYFDGAGRNLPNITDDRFIMGDTAAGSIGGNTNHAHSVAGHSHDVNVSSFTSGATTISISQMPSHDHEGVAHSAVTAGSSKWYEANVDQVSDTNWQYLYDTNFSGGSGSHSHSINPPNTSTTSDGATTDTIENRPKFLSCFYIIKVK